MVVGGAKVLAQLSRAGADDLTRLLLLVAAGALVAGGCQGTDEVRGVVVSIEGELDNITAFELVLEDGTRLQFDVGRDATFDGLPLSHLNEHRVSGDPVLVVYEEQDRLVAISIRDG